jgi:hypothetical protein
MMIHRGPIRVLADFWETPMGAAMEAFIVLAASGVACALATLALETQIAKMWLIASRLLGGLAFGLAFVTCQPYVFPNVVYVLRPLASPPFAPIARWCGVLFTAQPYVLLPTIILGGIAAWIAERLFRGMCLRRKATNQAMDLSPQTRVT